MSNDGVVYDPQAPALTQGEKIKKSILEYNHGPEMMKALIVSNAVRTNNTFTFVDSTVVLFSLLLIIFQIISLALNRSQKSGNFYSDVSVPAYTTLIIAFPLQFYWLLNVIQKYLEGKRIAEAPKCIGKELFKTIKVKGIFVTVHTTILACIAGIFIYMCTARDRIAGIRMAIFTLYFITFLASYILELFAMKKYLRQR